MTDLHTAAKLALEALKKSDDFLYNWHESSSDDEADAYSTARQLNELAFTALREALTSVPDWASEAIEQPAQPQQEPVAWKHDCAALLQNDVELWVDRCPHCGKPRTTPQAQPAQRKPWVGLTPNDIRGLCANTIPSTWDISLCRLVEKFLKEKNNA